MRTFLSPACQEPLLRFVLPTIGFQECKNLLLVLSYKSRIEAELLAIAAYRDFVLLNQTCVSVGNVVREYGVWSFGRGSVLPIFCFG